MSLVVFALAGALGAFAGGAVLLAIADLVVRRRRARAEQLAALERSCRLAARAEAEQLRQVEVERERWELEEQEHAQLDQLDAAIAHATREHDEHARGHVRHFADDRVHAQVLRDVESLRAQTIVERTHRHLHRQGRPLHPSLHGELVRRVR